MFNLEEELKKLPAKPGVYIMHDKWDNIIYIGKAKILKNRVRQYFQSSRNKSAKIVQMVSHIQYFEYIIPVISALSTHFTLPNLTARIVCTAFSSPIFLRFASCAVISNIYSS